MDAHEKMEGKLECTVCQTMMIKRKEGNSKDKVVQIGNKERRMIIEIMIFSGYKNLQKLKSKY